jgi:23S rRNA (cytidine1920-2'-O)/16S rRNA (cytidine1409-2'-O)-methyltransferase
LLVDRGLAPNRSRAQALLLAGRVRRGTERLTKPGQRVAVDLAIEVDPGRRYVGRGAHKLEAALEAFDVQPEGRDCLDVGASTGGFTQVLLLAGAARVIALDVGRGQLDWSLRSDPRVEVLEGLNARHLESRHLPFAPSLAVIDVSFISLDLVLPPVVGVLDNRRPADLLVLIKPQFEVGKGQVGSGGVVRDSGLHRGVLQQAVARAARLECGVGGLIVSPLSGADGNREFLMHLIPGRRGLDDEPLDRALQTALVSPIGREVDR